MHKFCLIKCNEIKRQTSVLYFIRLLVEEQLTESENIFLLPANA